VDLGDIAKGWGKGGRAWNYRAQFIKRRRMEL